MEDLLVLSASPRKGGNSDFAASLVLEAMGSRGKIIRVADAGVQPCSSCGYCDRHPGKCALASDGADEVFQAMLASPMTVFVSPVYFYHLPAQAKAFLDRMQRWWAVPGDRLPGKGRFIAPVLLGARKKGDRLFEGSLLTLKYAADTVGMKLKEPVLLHGLDAPGDLWMDKAAQAAILAGVEAWQTAMRQGGK